MSLSVRVYRYFYLTMLISAAESTRGTLFNYKKLAFLELHLFVMIHRRNQSFLERISYSVLCSIHVAISKSARLSGVTWDGPVDKSISNVYKSDVLCQRVYATRWFPFRYAGQVITISRIIMKVITKLAISRLYVARINSLSALRNVSLTKLTISPRNIAVLKENESRGWDEVLRNKRTERRKKEGWRINRTSRQIYAGDLPFGSASFGSAYLSRDSRVLLSWHPHKNNQSRADSWE